MPERSEREHSLRATHAALVSWSLTKDRSARTLPARRAMLERFEKAVPAEVTDPRERALMVEAAIRAYFTGLALKSAQARRRRRSEASDRASRIAPAGSDCGCAQNDGV